MNFCFIHSKGSDGGMCRCICQNFLKPSGLGSPNKMPSSILSTSSKSCLQNRWNLREEKGEDGLCLWGLVQNRYSWRGYHSTEEKMEVKRQKDLGGKQKEEHLQEQAKRTDQTLNIRYTAQHSCGPREANLSHPILPNKCFLGANYCLSVTKSCQLFATPWTAAPSLPCPSLSPGVWANLCPLSWWCHPTISSSVVPFSFGLQSFPAPGCFPMSQLFTSGGQSVGTSTSASVLLMNIQGWFPLGWTDLISLLSKGLSRVFSSTIIVKATILWCPAFFMVQFSHWYMTTGKTITLTIQTFVFKVMSLLFNMLSRFVTVFLPRSRCLNFVAAVTNLPLFPFFPNLSVMKWWDWMLWS